MKLIDKYVKFKWGEIIKQFIKLLIASVIACALARLAVNAFNLNKYVEIAFATFIGVAVYIVELYLLRIDELHFLLKLMKRKVK